MTHYFHSVILALAFTSGALQLSQPRVEAYQTRSSATFSQSVAVITQIQSSSVKTESSTNGELQLENKHSHLYNPAPQAPAAQPPNVILVHMDDMGYGDLSITGAVGYHTPNFDAMAKSGMSLTQYYSPQAVCTASRAGLLTGCYPNRIGFAGAFDHTAKTGINPDEETIAELLKAKGYSTAAFGKWHLGHLKEFLPLQHGFDTFLGIPYSNDMWPNHPVNKNYYPPLPLIEGNDVIETNPDQSRFTTLFTERSIDFIQQNKDKPFFI